MCCCQPCHSMLSKQWMMLSKRFVHMWRIVNELRMVSHSSMGLLSHYSKGIVPPSNYL